VTVATSRDPSSTLRPTSPPPDAGPVAPALPDDPTELFTLYAATIPAVGRLRANMVVSLDGRTTIAARSGGLSGDADRRVFAVLRAQADAVLVGAGTVRAEGYRPAVVRPEFAELREAHGSAEPPTIAIVSRSLDLPLDAPLLNDPRTLIVTCASSPTDRREVLAERTRVIVAGEQGVDLVDAVDTLNALGLTRVLCEGGPALLADAVRADLVDELCLTIAPIVVGDAGPSLISGTIHPPARWIPEPPRLADGMLFMRYRADRVDQVAQ
jgi:riboflavin-specific deaminase-like protein